MENEEINLINALNPGHSSLVAEEPPPSPLLPLAPSGIGPTEPMAPPLYYKRQVYSLKTHQGTEFGQGASLSGPRQFPLRQYPIDEVNQEAQPTGYYWVYSPL